MTKTNKGAAAETRVNLLIKAVEWIALNDQPGREITAEDLAWENPILLVADVFDWPASRVASMVLECRAAERFGLSARLIKAGSK